MEDKQNLDLLIKMLTIRRLEEFLRILKPNDTFPPELIPLYGEEPVATGIMNLVRPEDNVITLYRPQGFSVLKGLSLQGVIAEALEKESGYCRGRGGVNYLVSKEHRFWGGPHFATSGAAMAVGLAYSAKIKKENRITYFIFNDSLNFDANLFEAFNLAKYWKAPILFCYEKNIYDRAKSNDEFQPQLIFTDFAQSSGLPYFDHDGMDVHRVIKGLQQGLNYLTERKLPVLVEFRTYRYNSKSSFGPRSFPNREQLEQWKVRCPIEKLKKSLTEAGVLTPTLMQEFETKIERELAEAHRFAEVARQETIEDLQKFIYATGGTL